ncbi:hypothetical protein MMC19_003835 [Ptychographa xylographoides]|nr:hypothetical protein [Ptychographa xylographoides]
MSPYDDPINFDPYDRPKRTRAPYEGPNDFDNYDRPRPPPRTSNRYSGPNDFDNIDRPPQSSAPYSQYPPSSFTREPSPTYASRHQYRSPFPDEPYRPNYREENPFANVYNPYSTSPPNVSSFGSTEQYGSGPSYGSRGRDSDSSSSRPTPGPESRERTRSSHWWSSASGHRSSEPHSGGQSQNSDPSPPRRGGGVFDWFGTSPSPTTDGFSSKRGRTGYPGDYNSECLYEEYYFYKPSGYGHGDGFQERYYGSGSRWARAPSEQELPKGSKAFPGDDWSKAWGEAYGTRGYEPAPSRGGDYYYYVPFPPGRDGYWGPGGAQERQWEREQAQNPRRDANTNARPSETDDRGRSRARDGSPRERERSEDARRRRREERHTRERKRHFSPPPPPPGGTTNDPYATLGVPWDASDATIRSAYRKLCLRFHPDKVKDPSLAEESAARFLKVQEAYEFLTDSG